MDDVPEEMSQKFTTSLSFQIYLRFCTLLQNNILIYAQSYTSMTKHT